MNTCYKKLTTFFLVSMIVLAIVTISGCKEKTEPEEIAQAEKIVAEAIEQKTCPVMEGAINKELFTEYKGKKVYFCCPGCKEKFLEEPEKYISKLPQFND
jgi:YHS domain-containing protein